MTNLRINFKHQNPADMQTMMDRAQARITSLSKALVNGDDGEAKAPYFDSSTIDCVMDVHGFPGSEHDAEVLLTEVFGGANEVSFTQGKLTRRPDADVVSTRPPAAIHVGLKPLT